MLNRFACARRRVAVLAAMAALLIVAGCGVKSTPDFPDGTTYPLNYPPGSGDDAPLPATADPAMRPKAAPAVRTAPDGTYNPPPAATDPNFR